jgi:hypothetical protein
VLESRFKGLGTRGRLGIVQSKGDRPALPTRRPTRPGFSAGVLRALYILVVRIAVAYRGHSSGGQTVEEYSTSYEEGKDTIGLEEWRGDVQLLIR